MLFMFGKIIFIRKNKVYFALILGLKALQKRAGSR